MTTVALSLGTPSEDQPEIWSTRNERAHITAMACEDDNSARSARLASRMLLPFIPLRSSLLFEEVLTLFGSGDELFGKAINSGVDEPVVLGSFLDRRDMVGHDSSSRAYIG